jgi:regulator of protease activity HflC (stomatin/prohibitin superfamily)
MSKSTPQSGGVNIPGRIGVVGGDIVGGDKIVGEKIVGVSSAAAIDDAFRPVLDAIKAAPSQVRPEAETKLKAIKQEAVKQEAAKQEAAKQEDRDDGVMAKLLNELIGLIPAAASAVGSAFATPFLGALVGPATKLVLDKLKGK